MSYLNLLNSKNVKIIDSALEKVSRERDEHVADKVNREKRERDHQDFMKYALGRMKSGDREKFLNKREEVQKKGMLDGRLAPIRDVKVSNDEKDLPFNDAVKEKMKEEPLRLRIHREAGGKVSGKMALKRD